MAIDKALLLPPDPRCPEGSEYPLCTLTGRWLILPAVAMMPFGVHMCYKMTSGIQTHLMNDTFSPPIDTMQYGLLNSAVSWFNLAVPLWAGPLADRRSTRLVAIVSAIVGLLGQLLFTIGCRMQIFEVALLGRSVFGCGEGALMIAQGTAIAQWFRGAELTFAIACTEMTHCLANWTGKIAVSIAIAMGSWFNTLWIGVGLCAVGVVAACLFGILEHKYEQWNSAAFVRSNHPACNSFMKLPLMLWIILAIHLLVSNVEHLFDTISANFIQSKWHDNTSDAALLSSLNYAFALILCPAVGFLIDNSRLRMPLGLFACCLLGSAHLLLGLTMVAPFVGLLLLSLPGATMPTILRSSTPLVVSPSVFGLAFGAFGIAESAGKTVGAPLIGYIKDQDGNYTHVEMGFAFAGFLSAFLVLILWALDKRNDEILVSPMSCLKFKKQVMSRQSSSDQSTTRISEREACAP